MLKTHLLQFRFGTSSLTESQRHIVCSANSVSDKHLGETFCVVVIDSGVATLVKNMRSTQPHQGNVLQTVTLSCHFVLYYIQAVLEVDELLGIVIVLPLAYNSTLTLGCHFDVRSKYLNSNVRTNGATCTPRWIKGIKDHLNYNYIIQI